MRYELLSEVFHMAFQTLRTNKVRSALTILGVVIGVMSIVGMTSLVRGLDASLQDSIRQLGPRSIFVARFSGMSLGEGGDFRSLIRRPNLTLSDADAINRAPSIALADVTFGIGGPPQLERVSYRGERTKPLQVLGTTENFLRVTVVDLHYGRFFTASEVERRRPVVVLGQTAYQVIFEPGGIDPIGKTIRVGPDDYTIVGVTGPRASPGGFNVGVDDFVVIPESTYRKNFGIKDVRFPFGRGFSMQAMMITAVARDDVPMSEAIIDVEEVMRIRHGLTLDQPNDFDVLTQDAVLTLFGQISDATFLALLVLSSIALLVGGIGVMAIMMITVTERTREIGIRKALGARRREILMQFLTEAATLTLAGGIIGVAFGAAIGVGVHLVTGFPLALPWWTFAIGLGFSTAVGVFFGMVPAVRASRLDPIEALRHE